MIGKKLSVKKMFFGLTAGMTLTMTAIILVAFFLTKNIVVLWVGMALIVCAILWMLFMVQLLGMRLSNFTSELCQILDDMMKQVDGLNTVLPYGIRKINALRTLTTESTAVLIPFHTQEIMQPGGIYYGRMR